MRGSQDFISPQEAYARLGTAAAPIVIDVRRPFTFTQARTQVAHHASGASAVTAPRHD